jgi:fatty acid-binding protein DegV
MGMRKGIDYQCKQVAAKPIDPEFPFYAMYTNQPAVARELAKKLETAGISVDEDHIIQVGASIGSHIGPDACGLVYVASK